ncbi:unnamed protein product, partial [Arabidopsis halleri]
EEGETPLDPTFWKRMAQLNIWRKVGQAEGYFKSKVDRLITTVRGVFGLE